MADEESKPITDSDLTRIDPHPPVEQPSGPIPSRMDGVVGSPLLPERPSLPTVVARPIKAPVPVFREETRARQPAAPVGAVTAPTGETRRAEPWSGLVPGRLLDGRYEIIKRIGIGGMGEVFLARDTKLFDKAVAVKVLTAAVAKEPSILQRFEREARAASTVPQHPNVVKVQDYGVDEKTNLPYMVMEYVSGDDLATRLKTGKMPQEQAVDLILGVCKGLAQIHDAGVIHRDLKPQNIMIERHKREGDVAKILDFGISKIVDDVSLTGAGTVVGTWRYLSPEQARGQGEIDVRSDQYGLATLLYQCLLGVRAFEGDPGAALLQRIVKGDFRRPTAVDPTFDKGLEKVILKAMAREPDDRFATIAEFAAALIPFASPKGQRLSSDLFMDNPPSQPLIGRPSDAPKSQLRLRIATALRSPLSLVALAAAALVIVAVVVVSLRSSRPQVVVPAAHAPGRPVSQATPPPG